MLKKPIVLLALALSMGIVVSACKGKENQAESKPEHHEQGVEKADMALNDVYQCPMDCEDGKTYDAEGDCPVCKMKLQKVEKSEQETHDDHAGHDHSDSEG